MPPEDMKETFKKLTQQQSHEIDLCINTFKTPWEERESRFDTQKPFNPVCGR